MSKLPSRVSLILMEHIAIVETVAMFAIGCYNAFEVGVTSFDTFKRYRGLYFWSMQVASWGILLHAVPAQLRYVSQAASLPTCIPFILGWYAMVTGQAVVLYSRLHLVVADIRRLRWVLWMIIINFMVLQIPMTVLFFGLNLGDRSFARPAQIYDRIQLIGFCIQDFVICGIYIREAIRALQPVLAVKGRDGRKVIIHLILVNIIVVIMNISLLITEFKLHYIQVSYKTVVYSIKLKIEFAVLTRLRELTRTYPCICQHATAKPRASSDINLFRMVSIHQPDPSSGIESTRACTETETSQRQTPGSTHDFHVALRAAEAQHPLPQSYRRPSTLSSDALTESGAPICSLDTRSTLDITLLEFPKR